MELCVRNSFSLASCKYTSKLNCLGPRSVKNGIANHLGQMRNLIKVNQSKLSRKQKDNRNHIWV